ncbi:bifunctional hydroxymethylpyrimidine kinase/phosphomethylpyrimidine kinase [Crocinitomicaceae bacterium]|jgi:hydroxymethylpyrimidine/phosphomethylpyrimidine kinase|nr:bifunctional hydroxymethylpyrimidine kinase/phosphomethylpyrimidine kinase [Crocinitomicaceae bacterium]
MPNKRPYCLTIAGFDPSGGAGILADIKTYEQHRCQGLAVVTANTIQTEDSFEKTEWVTEDTILLQLKTLMSRYKVRFFKIGLIESGEMLEEVLQVIHANCDAPTIIWDPIIGATVGGEFDKNRFSIFLKENKFADLIITPNLPEYESLGLKSSANLVYLKGGHSIKKGHDVLFWKGNQYPFAPKIKTDFQKHGTGCIFSSALLSNLALDYPMIKSCLRAKRYVEKRIVSNPSLLAWHK